MRHVMIGGYVYGYAGTPTSVPVSTIQQWVNWAQTDEAHAALLRSAGLKVDIYTIFWRNHSTEIPSIGYTDLAPGGAHAAAEAKDCNGNAIYDSSYGGGYLADARVAAAAGHAQTVASYREREYAGNYDAIFSDDVGSMYGVTAPCNYDEQSFDNAINAVDSSLGVPIFVNALGNNAAYSLSLVNPSNVIGAMCEECYGNNSTGTDTVSTAGNGFWQHIENSEIGMVAAHKIFWDYARLSGNPALETGMRTYVYSSFLLTFDPAYTMFEEAFPTPSGLPVMPETGLVVLQPLSTASSVSGYLSSTGAYFREFGACYYLGAFVNKCAVVVNPGKTSVSVPTTSYSHSMTLAGSGVLDGGTASFNGPQITALAPASGAVLFP